jgi:hypothetical protein
MIPLHISLGKQFEYSPCAGCGSFGGGFCVIGCVVIIIVVLELLELSVVVDVVVPMSVVSGSVVIGCVVIVVIDVIGAVVLEVIGSLVAVGPLLVPVVGSTGLVDESEPASLDVSLP